MLAKIISCRTLGSLKQCSGVSSSLTNRALSTGGMFAFNPILSNVLTTPEERKLPSRRDMAPIYKQFADTLDNMWKEHLDTNVMKLSFTESPTGYLIEAGSYNSFI
jgi:hypothetical protein